MKNVKLQIVAISGSLRAHSSATLILKYMVRLFPDKINFFIYEDLGKLPHFDDNDNAYPAVNQFRKILMDADGVLICQPEYAFGVAGSLKNALDWTVSSGELVNKPVVLVTAATGGDKAHAALLLTLKALSSKVKSEATLLIPYIRTKLNEKGEIINTETAHALESVMQVLIQCIREHQNNEPANLSIQGS